MACVVPRQNGKGSILEARQLAGLFVLNEPLQIHSAHEFKTAYEHFLRVRALIEDCPALSKHVKIIRKGAGEQGIELKNGCRLRFLTRSRSSGRGFSSDTIYLDEAFELDGATMGAILPTLIARENPSIWYTSSAPHKNSDVLRKVCERGRSGEGGRLYYAEWGNDADVDPTDPEAWRRANPSLGFLIDEDSIEMARSTLTAPEFAREHLGVAEEPVAAADAPIPLEVWDALTDGESMADDARGVRLALDISPDRQWATFGIAGIRTDGLRHVAVRDRRQGTDWILDRARVLSEGHGTPIIVAAGSPGAAFAEIFESNNVPFELMSTADYGAACGRLVDGTRGAAPTIRHRGDPSIRLALAGVVTKLRADGEVVWSRRSTEIDITVLTAVTMAHGRLDTLPEATEYLGGLHDLDDWLDE